MSEAETRTGDWLLLFVQGPGRELTAAGVLLLDPKTNELSVQIGELPYADEDIEQVLELVPEDIAQQSREYGGAQVLSSFEETWSNTFQIGERQPVRISNPQHTLTQLFEEHIARTASAKKPFGTVAPSTVTRNDLLQARRKLPKSPQVIGKALGAIRHDRTSRAQIADIISEDPVIAAHLIKLANSVLYQHRGGEVRSVVEAISRLGTKSVEKQIVSACMRTLFVTAELREAWNHAIDIASICGQLAVLMRYPDPDEAILAGLVHDIGRIIFEGLERPAQEASILENKTCLLYEVEQHLYGISHAEVGADLLTDWNFPADMVEAVRHHHRPQDSSEILCSLLHLAESWAANHEDVWGISDHSYALNRTRLPPHYFLLLRLGADAELESFRFAA